MDHGTAASNDCKISMLWNWETKDACFLSSEWQIANGGMMAASCIGVGLLVVVLEVLRLMGKKFDAMILAQMKRRGNAILAASSASQGETPYNDRTARTICRPPGAATTTGPRRRVVMRVSPVQQLLRAILYAVTFGVAYIIMLLAMYFNGYIIMSIVIGAGLGKFLCDWLSCTIVLEDGGEGEEAEKKAEGIEEPTVCCQ